MVLIAVVIHLPSLRNVLTATRIRVFACAEDGANSMGTTVCLERWLRYHQCWSQHAPSFA